LPKLIVKKKRLIFIRPILSISKVLKYLCWNLQKSFIKKIMIKHFVFTFWWINKLRNFFKNLFEKHC
jgi:hypothetical protein